MVPFSIVQSPDVDMRNSGIVAHCASSHRMTHPREGDPMNAVWIGVILLVGLVVFEVALCLMMGRGE